MLFSIDTDLAKPVLDRRPDLRRGDRQRPGSTWRCPGGLVAAASRRTPLRPDVVRRRRRRRRQDAPTAPSASPARGAAALSAVPRGRGHRRRVGDVPPPPPRVRRATRPDVPFGGVDPLWRWAATGCCGRCASATAAGRAAGAVPAAQRAAVVADLRRRPGLHRTSNGCGNAPNAVWAIDLPRRRRSRSRRGRPAARTSPACVGPDARHERDRLRRDRRAAAAVRAPGSPPPDRAGATPTASSRSSAIRLKLKDWFTATGPTSTPTPVVFRHKSKDYLAVTGNDGRLYLLDGAALGGGDHKTPLYVIDAFAAAGRRRRPGDVAGRRRHALGAGARTGERDRRASRWSRRTASVGARSGLEVAPDRRAAGADRRQRDRVRGRERRVSRHRGQPHRGGARQAVDAGGALRARSRRRARSSGRAARRSRRSRGPGWRPAAARSISSPTTTRSMPSASPWSTDMRLRSRVLAFVSLGVAATLAAAATPVSAQSCPMGGAGQGPEAVQHLSSGRSRRVRPPDPRGLAGRDDADGRSRLEGHRRGAERRARIPVDALQG